MDQNLKEALLEKMTLADLEELVSKKWQHEAPRQIDINNPPKEPYIYQAYPATLYHHDNGHVITVKDAKAEAAALKLGFRKEPSPKFDYSLTRNGVAPSQEKAQADRERQERSGIMQVQVVEDRESA